MIYLLITIAFIAAIMYVAYTIYNIGKQSAQNHSILQVLRCLYTRSICITTEPVTCKTATINGKPVHVVIVGDIAIPTPSTIQTVEGTCTNPPCIIINTGTEIKIVQGG